MNKKEAVQLLVNRDLQTVPQDWAMAIAEREGEYQRFGMWGWVFIVDDFIGERLMKKSRIIVGHHSDIDLNAITNEIEREAVAEAIDALNKESISWGECALLENYMDEEMAGERCILDTQGRTTSMFIHEIAGTYCISVNAAGFDFYDGVWDVLYDTLCLEWHTDDEESNETVS